MSSGGYPNGEPTVVIRAALVCAAALPWFAVFSGTFGLYFYILLAAELLLEWLFVPLLFLAVPLAVLLLVVMPAGAVCAASGRLPGGWFGWLTRAGCLVSLGFTVVYAGLMVLVAMLWIFREDVNATWEPFILWRVVVLVAGLWAIWRAWWWLHHQVRHSGTGRHNLRLRR